MTALSDGRCCARRGCGGPCPSRYIRLVFAAAFVRGILAERADVTACTVRPCSCRACSVGGSPCPIGVRQPRARDGLAVSRWALEGLRARHRVRRCARCAVVITVSDGIAERLQELYALPETRRSFVMCPMLPRPIPHRTAACERRLASATRRLCSSHQGSAAADRGSRSSSGRRRRYRGRASPC